METKLVINILGAQCSPEAEAIFDAWYSEKHVPDVLKCKAVKKVTRYKLMDTSGSDNIYPKFLAVYEFADRQGFEEFNNSAELAAAREDTFKVFQETDGKMLWRAQYELIGTWEQ